MVYRVAGPLEGQGWRWRARRWPARRRGYGITYGVICWLFASVCVQHVVGMDVVLLYDVTATTNSTLKEPRVLTSERSKENSSRWCILYNHNVLYIWMVRFGWLH